MYLKSNTSSPLQFVFPVPQMLHLCHFVPPPAWFVGTLVVGKYISLPPSLLSFSEKNRGLINTEHM